MLKVDGVTLRRFNWPAVSFNLDKGDTLAIVAPTGGAQGELLDILAGAETANSGQVSLNHFSPTTDRSAYKQLVGYANSEQALPDFLTGWEYLAISAGAYNLGSEPARTRLEPFKDSFGSDWWSKTIEQMDNRQRSLLTIISSLVHQPRVIIWRDVCQFLDGLDQRRLSKLLEHQLDGGATLIISDNNWSFCQTVASQFLLLDGGHQLSHGSLGQLRDRYHAKTKNLDDIMLSAHHELNLS